MQCRKHKTETDDDDLPLVKLLGEQEIERCYWRVSNADIRREFPNAICCRGSKTDKKAEVWMTPLFLFEICMSFHECLNARELRRRLASLYSAHALAEQVRAERD